MSSTLLSQQSMVDIASRSVGAWSRRASPRRSPSRRHHRDSGSPARSSKYVRFDSPAPSSVWKGSKHCFCRQGSCPSSVIGGCLVNHGRFGNPGGLICGSWRSCGSVTGFHFKLFHLSPVFQYPFRAIPPSSIQGITLDAAMVDLRAKGAIEPAPSSPGYYSRLFVTPKVTGGWRPVIDLSRLNRYVLVSHFHTKTGQSVLQSLRPRGWMVSLDLQDTYLQVPVHPSSRRYLWFCVGDVVYQFRALCFGLSTAPHTFTRVMAPISLILHCYGFRILRYLDDWLVLRSSFQEIVRARNFLFWLCQELGICVNLSKSSLTPFQTIDYLGMRLQMRPLRVFPTPKRILKLSSRVLDFVSCRQQLLSPWRQLLGVMSSLSSIVPGSCLRMRSLQLPLNTTGCLLEDSATVSWDDSCLDDLWWWSVESPSSCRSSVRPS